MIEIFIERNKSLLRVAIKENGVLNECFVEEDSEMPKVGEIYKGRVKNILGSINSIFVDIGLEKEAYMYFSNEIRAKGIKKGDEILVEILKEPLGNKGAKVTKNISIAGRFMVITKDDSGIKFSRRIENEEDKLRIIKTINTVKGYGITIRTEATEATEEELLEEKNNIIKEIESLENKLKYSTNLGKAYGENVILNKVLRRNLEKGCKIIVDNEEDFEEINSYIQDQSDITLEKYEGYRNLFDIYGIEKEIIKLRHKKVSLNCGGNIVIDKTEAMYVIDINTAKNIKGKSFNKTILETNLEAAKEIGRQIRLRNLAGIIVIDFIDMRDYSQKAMVMEELKKSLSEDKGNVRIFPFTDLDLVQISRKRVGKSIYEYLEEPCLRCHKEGYVLKLSYIEGLLKNHIIRVEKENNIKAFYIELDKNYKEMVEGDIFTFLTNINGLDKEIYLNFVDDIEGYKIETLIFNSQKENIENYKINHVEKC